MSDSFDADLDRLLHNAAAQTLRELNVLLISVRVCHEQGHTPNIKAMALAVDGQCETPQEVPVAAQVDGGRDARVAKLIAGIRNDDICPVCADKLYPGLTRKK